MIFLQVILGILALILTPVVLLMFFIQSRHFLYRAGTMVLLLGYSYCLMFSYGSAYAGIYVFLVLFVLQQIVYFKRRQNIDSNMGRKYVLGQVITQKKNFSLDFIISLLPLYFIKSLPFSLVIRPKENDMEIRLKEIIQIILEHGADTTVDIDAKDVNVRFRMV